MPGAYFDAGDGSIGRNANTEVRARWPSPPDERLQQALRAEIEAVPGAVDELSHFFDRGGAALANKMRRYFDRRIYHCALIRSAAHAKAMPNNGLMESKLPTKSLAR